MNAASGPGDERGDTTDVRDGELWAGATRHGFVAGVRDGSLPAAAFDHWLAQDALFAADLLGFQALLLARAPRGAQAVLATGCVGIVEELAWFEQRAAHRGVDLAVGRDAATTAYGELLDRLDAAPVDVALTGLWTIEQVYLDAWGFARTGMPGPYAPFVEHWTVPAFAAYVAGLAELADPQAHRAVVEDVLRHEVAFWDAAFV